MPFRLPLLGGADSRRSPIASVQRCINYFPEKNREDSVSPTTHYQRPGLRALVSGENAPVRGLYSSSQGRAFACIGQSVYEVRNGTPWTLTLIGKLTNALTTPVSFADNGVTMVIGDGSGEGYQYSFVANTFSIINDPTGIFTGATRWDYIDTFLVWAIPSSPSFGSTLSNGVVFDALYTAGKTIYPDPLQTLYVFKHNLLLLGTKKSEIWYDAGGALFPFAALPGASIEHGTCAKYSVAGQDTVVYWLGQDLQGQGIVLAQHGYDTKRISNHAVETAIRKMSRTVGIGDAIGYCHQQDGHVFYVLSFPAGGQTWVFDEAISAPDQAWHQRCWTDPKTGQLGRDRTNCYAPMFGLNVVGDYANGTLYDLDPGHFVDSVAGVDGPITYVRTFPHLKIAASASNSPQPVESNFRKVQYQKFVADLECGNAPLNAAGEPAEVVLRYSTDRGVTWGNDVLQSAGAPGEFETSPLWRALGMSRDMVFELQHTIAGEAALNGAFVECSVTGE